MNYDEKIEVVYSFPGGYLETLPDSREKSQALTRLEESFMWAISAIQKHGENDGSKES